MSEPENADPAKATDPVAEVAPAIAADTPTVASEPSLAEPPSVAPEPPVPSDERAEGPAPELVAILETLAHPAPEPAGPAAPPPPPSPRERLRALAQLSAMGKPAAEAIPATAPATAPSSPTTTAASAAAIEFHDLTLGYEGHPAVHHLDGAFAKGSLTAVVGPNGSGKSTLLKGIMGQLPPLGGHLHLNAGAIAYLPQMAEVDRGFPARVADLAGLGLVARRGVFGGYTRSDRAHVLKALSTVGLEGFARRPLDTLSGGQLQRALFARVLVQDAPVILLDEPFTAIDEQTVSDLLALIAQWNSEGRTVIAVLHDLELVRKHFPQTLLLAREPIGWGATASVLTEVNLTRARRMPEAWDDHAPWHAESSTHEHDHGAKA